MAVTIQPTDIPSFETFKEEKNIKPSETTQKIGRAVIDPNDTKENAELDEEKKKILAKSNYEKEEENTEEKEEQVSKKRSIETEDPELKEVISQFERARELGMFLGLPQDFKFDGSPEKTEEAFRIDQETRYKLATKDLEDRVQDPLLREAIQYGINGGKFADMKSYMQAQKSYLDIANLKVENDTQAKDVITKELKSKGLKDNVIKLTLEQHEDEGTLLTEAQDIVKGWAEEKAKQKKVLEQEARNARLQEERENAEYEREFVDTLKKTGLPERKQDEILGAFDPITLENGQVFSRYELVRSAIENNTEHFIQYLDILNSYNPKTGFELSQYKTAGKTEQTKKIHDILFKSGTKPKGGKTFEETEEKPVFRNPLDRHIEVH